MTKDMQLAKRHWISWYNSEEGKPVGGALHIVTDDGNLSDDNIHWCRDWAESNGLLTPRLMRFSDILLSLTEEQREDLYYQRAGWGLHA